MAHIRIIATTIKGCSVERIEAAEDAQSRLRVEIEQEEGALVSASGDLDYATRHKLHAVFEGLFAQGIYTFAVDLSQIDFIDSSGLGLLIMTKRRVDSHKGRLPIVLNARIERILGTMQLLDFFERVEDRDEARRRALAHAAA